MPPPEELRALTRNGLREIAVSELKARGPRMDAALHSSSYQLIRFDLNAGQLFPRAGQVALGLLKGILQLVSPGLGLCGFISGFLLGALEERYLSPRLLLVGAELVQISVHGAVHLAPLSLWIIIFAVHAKETI